LAQIPFLGFYLCSNHKKSDSFFL